MEVFKSRSRKKEKRKGERKQRRGENRRTDKESQKKKHIGKKGHDARYFTYREKKRNIQI